MANDNTVGDASLPGDAKAKPSAAKAKASAAKTKNADTNANSVGDGNARPQRLGFKALEMPGKLTQAEQEKQMETRDLWIREFSAQLEEMLADFNDGFDIETNLTGLDRKRLTSARVRNNGFIDKAFDVARDNPAFLPPNFDSWYLTYKMRDLEDLRQLMAVVEQFQHSVVDAFIIQADSCFRDALRIYNSLNEQRRARVPGAAALFEILAIYFRTRRRSTTDEPTEKQLERDVKRLIKGTADGEIIIKNEAPRAKGGVHEVIDNVRSGRTAIKGTVEESVDEGK